MRKTGRPAGPLTGNHLHYLKILSRGERWYTIGNSLLISLVSRGLIEGGETVSMRRLFRITEAGRAVLQEEGRDE